MEWLTCIKNAINYMENHLLDIQSTEEVTNYIHISPMYLQKGFQIMTGYTIGEYIRNRKLYKSAWDIVEALPKHLHAFMVLRPLSFVRIDIL